MKMACALLHVIALASCCLTMAKGQQAETLRDAVECNIRHGLPNVLAKWHDGKEVRIGYFGGSITSQAGWRPKTLAWFKQQYPTANSIGIDASVPGIGSDLGVYRLHQDVLDHKPDLVFVEFAVNDGGSPTERIIKAIEGIVRQIWTADPNIDICFVYSLSEPMLTDLEAGKFPHGASVMEQVADHYGIPSIHMGMEVAKLHQAGQLIFTGQLPKTDAEKEALSGKTVFSPDGIHPYETTGHELYFQAIKRSFALIEQSGGTPGPHSLPPPLLADNWEIAKLVPLNELNISKDWEKLKPASDIKASQFRRYLPNLWRADRPGASVTIKFKGTCLLLYGIVGPDCGQIGVQIDDQPSTAVTLFDVYCSQYHISILPIADGLTDTPHTVVLRILPDQPDKLKILHQRPENADITMLDPKYDATAWYLGSALVLGEMLPPGAKGTESNRSMKR